MKLHPLCIRRIVTSLHLYLPFIHNRKICRCNNPCPRITGHIPIDCKLLHRKIRHAGLFGQFSSCRIFQILMKFNKPTRQRPPANARMIPPFNHQNFPFSVHYLSFAGEYPDLLNQAKFGVLVGTVLAGVLGYVVLNWVLPKREK